MTLEEAIAIVEERANAIHWGQKSTIVWYVFKWNDGYCFHAETHVLRTGQADWVYNTQDKQIRQE